VVKLYTSANSSANFVPNFASFLSESRQKKDMPHAVLDKKIDLQKLSKEFEEIIIQKPCLIKISNIFVDKHNRCSLMPTTVIEEKNQNFFIEVNSREGKTTVRLFPGTDPEKTDGVRTAIGLVVNKIQETFTNTKVTKTNIQEFLKPIIS
jgi:hypothetical protein